MLFIISKFTLFLTFCFCFQVVSAGLIGARDHDGDDDSCGTEDADEEMLDFGRELFAHPEIGMSNETAIAHAQSNTTIFIPVYWHTLTRGSSKKTERTDRSLVDLNIAGLNSVYDQANIRFELARYDEINDEVLGNGGKLPQLGKAYRRGSYNALNIYVLNLKKQKILGRAQFPKTSPNQTTIESDGVIIDSKALFGSKTRPKGSTLVHEIGHWLSLWHTFQNGCDEVNDFIPDTPAHMKPKTKKEKNQCNVAELINTCPNLPGHDPVDNYMNYVSDSCRRQFTAGQVHQMRVAWFRFRQIKKAGTAVPPLSSTAVPSPSSIAIPPSSTDIVAPSSTATVVPSPTDIAIPSPSIAVQSSVGIPVPTPSVVATPVQSGMRVPKPSSIPVPTPTETAAAMPRGIPVESPTETVVPTPNGIPVDSPSGAVEPSKVLRNSQARLQRRRRRRSFSP